MRLIFQAYSLAVFLVLTVNGNKSSKSCAKPYDKMMVCNLMCNLFRTRARTTPLKCCKRNWKVSLQWLTNFPHNATRYPDFYNVILIFKSKKFARQATQYSCVFVASFKKNIARVHAAAFTITSFAFRMSFPDL